MLALASPLCHLQCATCGTLQLDHAPIPAPLFHGLTALDRNSEAAVRSCGDLAARLLDRHALAAGDHVLDVGSNDGTLLGHFHARGLRTLGVEPCNRPMATAYHDGIETIGGQFGPFLARYILRRNGPARLVVSRFMLGVVPDVPAFAKAMGDVLTPDGVVVVQTRMTMYVRSPFDRELVHPGNPCAFTVRGLAELAPAWGLTLTDVEEGPGGTASAFVTFRPAAMEEGAGPRVRAWRQREAEAGLRVYHHRGGSSREAVAIPA